MVGFTRERSVDELRELVAYPLEWDYKNFTLEGDMGRTRDLVIRSCGCVTRRLAAKSGRTVPKPPSDALWRVPLVLTEGIDRETLAGGELQHLAL